MQEVEVIGSMCYNKYTVASGFESVKNNGVKETKVFDTFE